ncbi:MAG: shufflon system plasmid conjugative transfer pilus tip adhesin PilV, partial [Elusimicrobia bacterium]|nr:shufflon system plasmid conjugative transfer pilus tip adhesin PilV [Elusimicrobiota bacterium]
TDGTNGWYSQTYGGGWYMSDTSWLRTYNSKNVWTNTGLLGSEGGLTVGYGGTSPPSGGAIIAGNVGIANTAPAGLFEVGAGTMTVLSSGNVGIGTTSPGAALEVSGNILQENTNQLVAKNASGVSETWMWPRWSDNVM